DQNVAALFCTPLCCAALDCYGEFARTPTASRWTRQQAFRVSRNPRRGHFIEVEFATAEPGDGIAIVTWVVLSAYRAVQCRDNTVRRPVRRARSFHHPKSW